MNQKQYLAIDIGGTSVKLGVVDETGAVLVEAEEGVCVDGYETPILTTVLKAAKTFVDVQDLSPASFVGVGVSATGQIDSRKGMVVGTCGNFPHYIGSPIKAALEEDFGLPVTVANDANCMTLGEVWVGGAKGYTDVIGVTLGTGVGGGILTGGRLLEGARGVGGELGHYRTDALDGVDCTCGAKGCWERYAGATGLGRDAGAVHAVQRVGTVVSQLAAQTPRTFQQTAAGQDAAAHAGAQRDHDRAAAALGGTHPDLAQSGHVGIVAHQNLDAAQHIAKLFGYVVLAPAAEVCTDNGHDAAVQNRAGHAHAHAFHLSGGKALFLHLALHGSSQFFQNVFTGVGGVGGNFPLFQQFAGGLEQADLGGGAAQIDAECVFFHVSFTPF